MPPKQQRRRRVGLRLTAPYLRGVAAWVVVSATVYGIGLWRIGTQLATQLWVLAGVAIFLITALQVVPFVLRVRGHRRVLEYGIAAVGKITHVRASTSSSAGVSRRYVTVEFFAGGARMIGEQRELASLTGGRLNVGDDATVFFDPSNPGKFVIFDPATFRSLETESG